MSDLNNDELYFTCPHCGNHIALSYVKNRVKKVKGNKECPHCGKKSRIAINKVDYFVIVCLTVLIFVPIFLFLNNLIQTSISTTLLEMILTIALLFAFAFSALLFRDLIIRKRLIGYLANYNQNTDKQKMKLTKKGNVF
ncbi:putative RNA-binding Zn-ribbon protein involved in translation (DUF1610 family) [Breznakia sp. PF5-3]|uniref:hypothetical protein n=1 Tax=unclassified Breznakia TaxID=2623764 RepID=UPI002404EEA9|nr:MULTISPECIES: hypothetical protein [unclassified Breznakia]MDF9824867.1 putative RNA-binding Zn-ribbon protein involved in translation (DUF1610 family) [Breznakia sp. PM6-1]MDF9835724.1 putative RNA-binding Zn-ribbon protein involved in translation (DUF1610 family) [Breznakia sp. PF5-3]MDF9838898.1 putative RNA-binding Zn-ribbon protein involved in translation (DUF1610 family) [Breznakia sp. PFB2-8]MDF9860924.1 putative RNA-binding Zn-ribbon protein involved in translation (DUF1610 family) [